MDVNQALAVAVSIFVGVVTIGFAMLSRRRSAQDAGIASRSAYESVEEILERDERTLQNEAALGHRVTPFRSDTRGPSPARLDADGQ